MKSARSSRTAAPRSVGMGDCSCIGRLDTMDQLMLLLIGVVALMVNLGIMPPGILAYWPVVLIIFGLKELIRGN